MAIVNSVIANDAINNLLSRIDNASSVYIMGLVDNKPTIKEVLYDEVNIRKLLDGVENDRELAASLKGGDRLIIFTRKPGEQPTRSYRIVNDEVIIGIDDKLELRFVRGICEKMRAKNGGVRPIPGGEQAVPKDGKNSDNQPQADKLKCKSPHYI